MNINIPDHIKIYTTEVRLLLINQMWLVNDINIQVIDAQNKYQQFTIKLNMHCARTNYTFINVL